jgi:DNA repair exonuclease SbcCD ATPase subunit
MGTARQDFERFMRWLHEPGCQAPEATRKLANLVLANFDAVAGTSRQHHNRSQLMAQLAREHLAGASAAPPALPDAAPQGEWSWTRLAELSLGPFRGFRAPQSFDLSKRIVLCYGPNGGGKTSLCEGLEYALLGSVEEAGSKRINPNEYLANIHAGRFDAPALMAIDARGQRMRVIPDENAFRFFFVEKNRIDNFSRIAATPPGRKSDLIATLFGMDQFNDFASHFNESMDAALKLGTTEQAQLMTRRQALRDDEDKRAAEAGQLRALDEEAARYAGVFSGGLSFQGLKAMVGSAEAPGRLQDLEIQVRGLLPAITRNSRENMQRLFGEADRRSESLATTQRALDARSGEVSFRQLFGAVQALQPEHGDRCPACLTPLADASTNPFARAAEGLQTLEELARLETVREQRRRDLDEASRELRAGLRNLEEFLIGERRDDPVCVYLIGLPRNPNVTGWWTAIYSPRADHSGATPSLEQVLVVADQAAARDRLTDEALRQRDTSLAEMERLNQARAWIAAHEQRRTNVAQEAANAIARIERWEQANADLIVRAAEEQRCNERDRPIKEAYDGFVRQLERFRQQLPGMLMADLNAATMGLYNEFNHGDRDEDKLADLMLPLTGDGSIEIAFRGNPARRVNALTVLSEGHIRCLGLAILLAKAQSVRAPLIIFDDAINAIDHDHRSGIRQAIFETDRFRQTQIIVTCHSPEFVKDVENHLPREHRGDCLQYVLLHHQGDHQPRVNPPGTLNYLARAREAIDQRHNARDALTFARKSLEIQTHKAWKWLESHRIGNISVQIEGPGREPQLYGLCTALRRQLRESRTFAHASKDPLLACLEEILGIPESNLVWMMLNKGTHEEPDRDDFDMLHVETVLRVLGAIDALEMRPGR